jgi:hypothetical protein
MINYEVGGIQEAITELKRLRDGIERIGKARVRVGSNLKYAYGIEFGKHKGGSIARAAGGVFMLTNAIKAIQEPLKRELIQALRNGQNPIDILIKYAFKAQNLAMANTPVKTGSLRRSLHTIVDDR